MKIRKMTAADIASVATLSAQLGYECSVEELFSTFAQLVDHEDTGLFVGELPNGKIIGFMQIHEGTKLISGRRAELDALVMDENHRGLGFGRLMLGVAEDWVKRRGLQKLRLGTRTSRTQTHSFYTQYGFKLEKEWLVFTKSMN